MTLKWRTQRIRFAFVRHWENRFISSFGGPNHWTGSESEEWPIQRCEYKSDRGGEWALFHEKARCVSRKKDWSQWPHHGSLVFEFGLGNHFASIAMVSFPNVQEIGANCYLERFSI
jgi:hypothetical protein